MQMLFNFALYARAGMTAARLREKQRHAWRRQKIREAAERRRALRGPAQ